MNISNYNGSFKCNSWNEAESLIKQSSLNPFDDVWITKGADYPCLAILINGNHACVHYFLNDQGDMWQSVGYGDKDIVFTVDGEESVMPADSVVTLDTALECVKAFWASSDKPTCIEWREL